MINLLQFLLRLTGLYVLRRLTAARATQNTSRRKRLCSVLFRHIFLCAKIASQFFYRAQKNDAYSQNVMRNAIDNKKKNKSKWKIIWKQ
jgi:hypothetical protein